MTTTPKRRQRSANGTTRPFRHRGGWTHRPWVTLADGSKRQVQGSGPTQAAAIAAAEANAEEVRASSMAAQVATTAGPLVPDACRAWLELKAERDLAYKTAEGYRYAIKKWIEPSFGGVRVGQVTYAMVLELQNRVLGAASASTWRQAKAVLSQVLQQAARDGLLPSNPMSLLPPVKKISVVAESMTFEEATKIVAAAWQAGCELRWLLALSTGMRQGECLGLRWSNVHLDEPTPYIVVKEQLQFQKGKGLVLKTPKSARSIRTIPIDDTLVEAFRTHRQRQHAREVVAGPRWQGGDFVFTTGTGTGIRNEQDRDQWKAMLKCAGVRDLKLHSARHTAASLMFANNVPIYTVSSTLGHSSISITADIYGHVASAAVGEAVSGVARAIA